MHKILMLVSFFCVALFWVISAQAQSCDIIYEESSKMRKPEYGSYSVWSAQRGTVDHQELYRSATLAPEKGIVLVGERYAEKIRDKELMIAQMGNRGRLMWEVFHPLKGLEKSIKILPHKKGYMVVANIRTRAQRDEIWIGFFDVFGKLINAQGLSDKNNALQALDVVPDLKGDGYILAASVTDMANTHPSYSKLFRLDFEGHVVSDVAFVLGSENRILGLSANSAEGYIASGYSFGADGRKNGWLIKLGLDLEIRWQQDYPRGAGASLVKASPARNNTIAVVGTSAPAIKDGLRAGWVMLVDQTNGNVIWQRFYWSDIHYAGRDLVVSPDGIISVVLDGDVPEESQEQEHAQLITHDPRGVVMASDTFYSGSGVDVFSLVYNQLNERLLVGQSLVMHQVPKLQSQPQPEDKNKELIADKKSNEKTALQKIAQAEENKFDTRYSQQGWVLAAKAVMSYADPCVRTFTTLPE